MNETNDLYIKNLITDHIRMSFDKYVRLQINGHELKSCKSIDPVDMDQERILAGEFIEFQRINYPNIDVHTFDISHIDFLGRVNIHFSPDSVEDALKIILNEIRCDEELCGRLKDALMNNGLSFKG